MRTTVLAISILLPNLLINGLAAQSPDILGRGSAIDPVRVDPVHYTIESETECMLALRLKLGPDEASPTVYFQDALVVCTNECHVRLIVTTQPNRVKVLRSDASGTAKPPKHEIVDIHMEAGTTRLIGGGMRSIANLSTQPVEMLFIERKEIAADSK
jgi:hypothetical protein